jgi:serine/threonine protein kinase/tetratricopeptide (TPR) repeat protein
MTDTDPGAPDPRLDALVAELTDRVRAGEVVDPEREAARLPEHADRVRRAIATLGLLALAAGGTTSDGEPPDGTAADPPDRLGEFVLLGVLGRGGMGVVYEADQPSLRRRVALKTLPVGAALDPARLRRFELEAQVIGGLRHPHIVPVYAVGSDRGIPYFTMPRIDGESLDRLLDALRRPHDGDRSRPPISSLDAILALEPAAAPATTAHEPPPTAPAPRAANESTPGPAAIRGRDYIRGVARLAAQAADALAHAHAQGVVHRDIKPGNLMLDAAGHLWITDFGLARLRDGAPLTESGQPLGTLRYASPEQIRGGKAHVDGRADVYSLGVTLYELLTLRPAIAGDDHATILRHVLEAEPLRPRRLNPAIPRDLETIVLKAAAKEPDLRYPSAAALADDIRRFLDSRPIRARRPGLLDAGAKWARRNASLVAVAAAALVVLAAGLGAATWLVAAQRDEALRHARRAERRERFAVDTVALFRDAILNEPGLRRGPALVALRRRLLDQPLRFYDALITDLRAEHHTRPESLARLAQATFDLAVLAHEIGDRAASLRAFEDAVALLDRLDRQSPRDPAHRRNLAKALTSLGVLYAETGRPDEAMAAYLRSRDLLEEQARQSPPDADIRLDLARLRNNLGQLHAAAGRRDEALVEYRAAADLLGRLAREQPDLPVHRVQLAAALGNLANWQAEGGRAAEALRTYDRVIALRERLARDDPGDPSNRNDLARCLTNAGYLRGALGRPAEAIASLQRALEIQDPLARDHPDVHEYARFLATSLENLGLQLKAAGRGAEAIGHQRRCLEIRERLARDQPAVAAYRVELGRALNNLAVGLAEGGQPDEALVLYERALEIRDALARDEPGSSEFARDLAATLNNLANVELDRGQPVPARDKLRRARDLQRAALAANPNHPVSRRFLANHLRGLIRAARMLGDEAEAESAAAELDHLAIEAPTVHVPVANPRSS